MANHKSAIKQHRQNLRRRSENRFHRARMRTAVKQLRQAIAAGDLERARQLLPSTITLLDRSARSGAVHRNTASRVKSRLTLAVNRSTAAASA